MPIIDDLRSCYLLQRLSEEQLQRVSQRALRVHLSEGQILFNQGEPADRFFLVLRGQIKLYRLSPNGNEKIIEIIGQGNTFAEAMMFLERPGYPVCATALTTSELVSIDARDFRQLLSDSVGTCFILLGDMSQRLRGLIRQIDDLTLHTATNRVAAYLLAKSREEGMEFDLDIRKGVLASRLSVKPETFSRIIKQLNERGIVRVDGCRVRVLKLDALEALAEITGLEDSGPEAAAKSLYPCPPFKRG
jgi:CRP/FNR family transcriptional regulator, dissimilatory nitrate respiration regulator